MKTEFIKYHVAGGDWLISLFAGRNPKDFPVIAKSLCARHTGAGADGIAFVRADTGADARISIYRPDGSPCTMSLSALLCSARYISENICAGKTDLTISCASGSIRLILTRDEGNPGVVTVTADAGRASFLPDEVPVSVNIPVIDRLTEAGNRILRITALSCAFSSWAVTYIIDLQNCNTGQYGAILANHSLFPKKCDVVFAQESDIPDTVLVDTYIRGLGIPVSEGSAALAAVCAGVRLGRLPADRKIRIPTQSGELSAFCGADFTAMLSGEVYEIFRGECTKL